MEELRHTLSIRAPSREALARFYEAFGGEAVALQRLLLARKGKPQKALKMALEAIEFRERWGLPREIPVSDAARAMWFGERAGRTPDGSQILVFHLDRVDPATVSALSYDEIEALYVAWMEETLREDREWRGVVEVYDLKGVQASMMSPPAVALLSRVLSIGRRFYAEVLRRAHVCGVGFSSKLLWPIILRVLDKRTARKIRVTKDAAADVLRSELAPAKVE